MPAPAYARRTRTEPAPPARYSGAADPETAAHGSLVPPLELELDERELHVWRVSLAAGDGPADLGWATLSPDERARARRFHFDHDRRRFVLARGALRRILARYVWREPAQLVIAYGEGGKPELADARRRVEFNLSHSDELALIAVGRHGALGIDVERARPVPDMDELARRFFAPGESATLAAVAPERRAEAFFACWTRKEAYVKARGEGLSMPLASFEVSLAPGEPARLVRTTGDAAGPPRWSLHDLRPQPGYIGALAGESGADRLTWWDLDAEGTIAGCR